AAAETYLRRLIDPAARAPEEQVAQARRELALGLAGAARSKQALALLAENERTMGRSDADQRARALVLARRSGDRRAAQRYLEEAFKGATPTPPEQFELAKVWEHVARPAHARDTMLGLLAADGENAQYLAYHVGSLLRHGELDDAAACLQRLER